MNKNNIVLSLFFITFFGPINANVSVTIRNNYKNPITVNVDGYDIRELFTNESDTLSYMPERIKIKEKGSSSYHTGIQEELDYIKNAARQNANLTAVITILDTKKFFHFDYKTDITVNAPDKP